jgi:RecB family exonuclease
LNVSRPSWPAFTLNSAVDILLKKEFDLHRIKGQTHPLMKTYGIDAVPFQHPKMDEWRDVFKGVQVFHAPTNFLVFGAVDDIWVTPNKMLIVVDYKSTSTTRKIDLNGKWKQAYKRQMEIYQWLLRGQKDLREAGYRVSNKGFFVYANARKDEKAFDGKLEFDIEIIPYVGDDSWVEKTIVESYKCLKSKEIPAINEECEYCQYRQQAKKYEPLE